MTSRRGDRRVRCWCAKIKTISPTAPMIPRATPLMRVSCLTRIMRGGEDCRVERCSSGVALVPHVLTRQAEWW
jgi:hypothetical protein